jgi:hypothetical protein
MNLAVLEQKIREDMGRGKHLGEEGETWGVTVEGEPAIVTPTWDGTEVIAYALNETGEWKLVLTIDVPSEDVEACKRPSGGEAE